MWIKNNLCVANTYRSLLLELLHILNILNVNNVFTNINFILTRLSLFTWPSFRTLIFWLCFLMFVLPITSCVYFLKFAASWLNNRLWSFTCIIVLCLEVLSDFNMIMVLWCLNKTISTNKLHIDTLSSELLWINSLLLYHLRISTATFIKQLLPLKPLGFVLSRNRSYICNTAGLRWFPLCLIIRLYYRNLIDLWNLQQHLLLWVEIVLLIK